MRPFISIELISSFVHNFLKQGKKRRASIETKGKREKNKANKAKAKIFVAKNRKKTAAAKHKNASKRSRSKVKRNGDHKKDFAKKA